MSKVPVPQLKTDEEAADLDYLHDNYESDVAWQEWQSALDWAKKGDFVPLAECLRRTDLPLNNQDVRAWLADGLFGGFKKPRKTAKRPEYVLFENAAGRRSYIDKRHLKIFEAMRQVEQDKKKEAEEAIKKLLRLKKEEGDAAIKKLSGEAQKKAIKKAAAQFGQAKKKAKDAAEDKAIEKSAAQFEMRPEELRQHLRRARSRWGLESKRRDEMLYKMFADLPMLKPKE